ncbi:hypothetical protein ACHAQJ_004483 [Trichoderma viride]
MESKASGKDEKNLNSSINSPVHDDSNVSIRTEQQPEWNPAEEVRVLTNALTGGFAADIGVTQSTINLGNQLMFMSIVIFEIPCNMALQRIGPRKWISAQVLLFGFIAIMQVFIRNRGGFLATRLLLGFAEAGYIPGACYTLSTWYTKRELAKRIAIFFFGMFGGNAISPLLASGILLLDGHRGLRGWQWLFLHSNILLRRLELDGEEDRGGQGLKKIPLTKANALAAVGAFLALAVVFLFAFISDRTNQRGASVIAAQACYLITLIVAHQLQPHVGKWSRWGLWTAVNSFAVGYHPIHNSWVQLNCTDPRERSISIAMWVMSAISGLMAGAQYFQADDKPL